MSTGESLVPALLSRVHRMLSMPGTDLGPRGQCWLLRAAALSLGFAFAPLDLLPRAVTSVPCAVWKAALKSVCRAGVMQVPEPSPGPCPVTPSDPQGPSLMPLHTRGHSSVQVSPALSAAHAVSRTALASPLALPALCPSTLPCPRPALPASGALSVSPSRPQTPAGRHSSRFWCDFWWVGSRSL